MISQNYIYIYSSFAISFVVSLTIYISFFFFFWIIFCFRFPHWNGNRNWQKEGVGVVERERQRGLWKFPLKKINWQIAKRIAKGARVNQPAKQNRNQTSFLLFNDNEKKRERRLIIFSCFKYSGNTCKIWLASKMVKRWNNHSRSQHRSSVRSTLPEAEASSIEWSMLLNLDYIKICTLHTHRHTLWLWIVSCFNNLFET